MAAKAMSSAPGNAADMRAAAALLVEREQLRQQRARRRAKRRRRERRQAERKAVERMRQSIEVIKWCIVAICAVWLISFVISIVVLARVQSKVAEIQAQVDRIRHVMDNPFASAGARLGGQVDDKLKEFFRLPDEPSSKE